MSTSLSQLPAQMTLLPYAVARGMNWAEAGWVLEDNAPMSNALERLGFTPYKTYRLYDRKL